MPLSVQQDASDFRLPPLLLEDQRKSHGLLAEDCFQASRYDERDPLLALLLAIQGNRLNDFLGFQQGFVLGAVAS